MHALTRFLVPAFLLVALVALPLAPGTEPAEALPATRVVATAAATGPDASGLLHPSSSRHAIWRSDRPADATLVMRFGTSRTIDGSVIRAASASTRPSEVRLEFSDGSAVLAHANARGDRTVAFPARSVQWVRLIVTDVRDGQNAVALSGWTMHLGSGTRVSTSARRIGAPRVTVSSGKATRTSWTAARRSGQWIRLAWSTPVEISAVRLVGGAKTAGSSIKSGTLVFSDGSRVLVGSLEPSGGTSTTIAFTPRAASSVRFVVSKVGGGAAASLASFRAYPVGVVPGRPATTAPAYKRSWTAAADCTRTSPAAAPTTGLRLLCPTNGAAVGSVLRLVLSAPSRAAVTVEGWVPKGTGGAIRVVLRGAADAGGTVRLAVPTAALLHGPSAVRVTAAGVLQPLYVQFINGSGATQRIAPSPITRHMDLKYDETFSQPLSATRTGAKAVYASGKPNQYWVDDFGQAIFAQPDGTSASASTMSGGFLRIPAQPLPAGRTDGAGYGRTSTGGLLSSAHMGASGFVAQYGYFEARMLAPAGPGTWPAFWTLSSGGLLGGRAAAEVDAAEIYGATPSTVYQTTHSWVDGADSTGRQFVPNLPDGGDTALSWHTYGARILPTGVDFYIDGRFIAHTVPVVHADQPFFFLVDLALTPGWQDGLAPTRHRVALYVDSIRVWV